MAVKDRFLYTGRKTNEISFPLGGIGTGCIGISGNGRLVDWEIQNKPNKNSLNGFSHFSIKAESRGKLLDARVLHGDLHPPYTGSVAGVYHGFGFGVARENLTSVPHFKSVDFRGEYPIAQLDFKGVKFPGRVRLTAFNPFIPLNDIDSGIPAAFFEFEVKNTGKSAIDYTLAGTVNNLLPARNMNEVVTSDGKTFLRLGTDGKKPDEVGYGDLTLATDADDTSVQQYWFSGAWFDAVEVYWRDFARAGRLPNRVLPLEKRTGNHPGTLAAHFTLKPGQSKKVRFVLAWNFPINTNYWDQSSCDCAKQKGMSCNWKNFYATIWNDSQDSANYALKQWDRLFAETKLFKDALFASDIPGAALDAVSSTMSILKSPTVMRLEDGTFYGFEGCMAQSGCCEGSCTHVWNYQQALPFLFPALERSMRNADYKFNLRDDGGMPFRIQLPIGVGFSRFRPCGDGQFGGVMKVYRDWKICGDTEWLKRLWPAVKQSIEFAWSPANADKWDPDKTGVLHGRVHHTLDVELFGPNSWLTGMYLGALKAGAEMAEFLGEKDTAAEYRVIFERGKKWTDKHLFNGEYYCQKVDLKDKKMLGQFEGAESYWNEEHQEIKYQIGEGCEIDQTLAQWHANLYGLGEIFDPKQNKAALRSLFKYNFKPVMREYFNACRTFSLNDESGLVIGDWPAKVYRPMIPICYAGEAMHGFEYAAAIQMIHVGLMKEGMAVVNSVRDRYDGERRNPWNEFECGSNYARSMASYALLNAFGNFEFDMVSGLFGFNPIAMKNGRFRSFWSLNSGWGEFTAKSNAATVRLLKGGLKLNVLRVPFLAKKKVKSVKVEGKLVHFAQEGGNVRFIQPVFIGQGESLSVKC